ncbi:hypothetical protein LTR84_000622 [Exophiala bonariae]|uniref:Condensation domain-containing protein n=1 Tax=Exophiala bonariae TaxID=1690606 RepID=A0AAV9NV37_9EURO|nr:hypothetical protein LTR84_000622 [Exophiala bonariae]
MSLRVDKTPDWLESYATSHHDWQQTVQNGEVIHYRRIGVVEGLFNTDGIDYEGRADLTFNLQVELKTSLNVEALRERFVQAWAVLRQRHVLLSARVAQVKELLPFVTGHEAEEWIYVFKPCASPRDAYLEAQKHLVQVEDQYSTVRNDEFFTHTLNCSRCLDPFVSLSRFYVMPLISKGNGVYDASFMMTAGHEIVDGLTSMRWMSSLIHILNESPEQLRLNLKDLCQTSAVPRLPPAQESLYPSMGSSPARKRWSWLISRILRHKKKLPPASFQNPLRRRIPLAKAQSLPPKFSKILDYSRLPPLNTYTVRPTLSAASSQRLAKLCREARISIGSGCFALVALVMMLFEERCNPNIPANERLPFVGSFPVNPRPLLDGTPTTGKEDNLMLAFSEGIALRFLASELDFEGRFRLLGKQAHRQLRQYQKRPRNVHAKAVLGSSSPEQLLPIMYLVTMERLESKSLETRKRGWNIQGEYPARTNSTLATCGVSSVGPRGSIIASGKFNTSELAEGQELAVDFRELYTTVRARDGEFLVGAVGDNGILKFGVSYDGCAIDPALAEEWKQVMETIMEPKQPSSMSRL